MAAKTSLKVLIDGKQITLAGYEEEEYLQKVANYINRKIAGFSEVPGYGRMASELKGTLLSLNIADDYFKAKKQAEALEESMEAKDRDAYDLKQDLVTMQMENEKLTKEISDLKKELENLSKNF